MHKLYIHISILSGLLVSIPQVKGQSIQLSTESQISLLTCGAGEELYTAFGHSALHVNDDSLGIDLVFNYGTFDFNTPNFYLKFVNGELDYMLSASEYSRFRYIYDREQRSVSERVLKLSQAEKNELWRRLVLNYQPQNRFYRYDFFFDNCATRIRDLLFSIKGLNPDSYNQPTELSFRDYLHSAIGREAWVSQGIDLLLGAKTDEQATVYQRAYLPVYLDSLLVEVGLVNNENIEVYFDQSLEYTKKYTDSRTSRPSASHSWIYLAILILLAGLLLSYFELRQKKYFKTFDITLFSVVSLLSLLFWYAWLFTSHQVMEFNLNVLWASILYIPLIFTISVRCLILTRVIAGLNLATMGVFVLLNIAGVQVFAPIVYPVVALLALRNYRLLRIKL